VDSDADNRAHAQTRLDSRNPRPVSVTVVRRLSHRRRIASLTHQLHRRCSDQTMSLVARTAPALRRQILQSRSFAPSRGVHDYKVCAVK
jgi:hypothetical protein